MLVTPVAASDPRYLGLPVLRDTRGRSAVQTAAQLVTTSELAESVRARLGVRTSVADLLARVRARPAGASSVVAITARDPDPAVAAKLANSFAELLVAERTATLNSAIIDATTRTLQQLLALPAKGKASTRGAVLRTRLAQLRSLASSSDPSLQVAGRAVPPRKPIRLAELPIVLGALGGALLLGVAAGLLATGRRGREAALASDYDLAVTDRLVAQLEQRLADRMEALLAQQKKLSAREAELNAREQALEAAPLAGLSELAERERALAERLTTLTSRERELIRRAGELAARDRELATREEELEARAEEIAKRADELEERSAAAATPEPEPEPVLAEAPPIAAAPPPAASVSELPRQPGRWNLSELSRIVEERGPEFPDRHDEWLSYLFFLRSYAEPDGTLPSSFDWLVEETFTELVGASTTAR